jgi:capsular exopolysaccharide synthesis family protein
MVARESSSKIIMISSAQPKEGKSTIAANLSISLAQSGNRVLLVDADFRRPTIHEQFTVPNEFGLLDVAQGHLSISESIQKSDFINLDLLPSGTSASTSNEMIEMARINAALEVLREGYDYVLVDSAAYLGVTDSVEMADTMDGVLLVVRQGHVQDYALQETCNQLRNNATKLLGLIINNDLNPIPADSYWYYRESRVNRAITKSEQSKDISSHEEINDTKDFQDGVETKPEEQLEVGTIPPSEWS